MNETTRTNARTFPRFVRRSPSSLSSLSQKRRRARFGKSASQEASAIFRRKAIYEELHPETKHGGNAGGPCGQFVHTAKADFASATADATGKDERTVRRAVARGEALGDDLGAVTGTSLDKGVELDALVSDRLQSNRRRPRHTVPVLPPSSRRRRSRRLSTHS